MITTKAQAKPRERCLSRFPFSRLDVQCQRDEGHDGACEAIRGAYATAPYWAARYTWTPSLLPVTI